MPGMGPVVRQRRIPKSITWPAVWRRRPVLTLALLLLGGLIIYERGFGVLGQEDDYTRYHDKVFEVVEVVDGDTFDIDLSDGPHSATRIRLWGVDTPEVAGSRDAEMHYGPEAAGFARRRLLGRAVRVVLSPAKTRGEYGRLLAYVYLEPSGVMLNELLLEHGYAYADWRFPHPYKRQFGAIEERARKQGLGLWAGVTSEQMPPWRQRRESRSD